MIFFGNQLKLLNSHKHFSNIVVKEMIRHVSAKKSNLHFSHFTGEPFLCLRGSVALLFAYGLR